jgi:uncharacterized protein YukE
MDKIYVNYPNVRDRVKNGKAQLNEQRDLLNQLQTCLAAVSAVWDDAAQKEYEARINELRQESLTYIDKIQGFLDEVYDIAENCQTVDYMGRL